MKKNLGFTLLELLVVISIIGILLAMGAVAFTTAQKKGRDSKRRGDMRAVSKAFEQYYADNNSSYLAGCTGMEVDYMVGGALPVDPKTKADYTVFCTASDYCACAELEDKGSGNTDTNATSEICTFTSVDSKDFICTKNLQ